MKTVWKFPLQIEDEQNISIPAGFKFLTVQMQGETPCLWALVDDSASRLMVRIVTHGTGHPCLDIFRKEYIGTYQLHNLVFHVWG